MHAPVLVTSTSSTLMRDVVKRFVKRPIFWLILPLLVGVLWLILHLWAFLGWWMAGIVTVLFWFVHKAKLMFFIQLFVSLELLFVISVVWILTEHYVLHSLILGLNQNTALVTYQGREIAKHQVIPVDIVVTDIDQAINVAQLDIKFDQEALELKDFTYDRSFANIFLQQIIDNKVGFARLVVALPNPGFTGEQGVVATAYFQAKKSGPTSIFILPSSKLLLNNGKATDTFKQQANIALFIHDFSNQESHSLSVPATSENNKRNTMSLLMDEEILPNPVIFTNIQNNGFREKILIKIELFDSIVLERYGLQ